MLWVHEMGLGGGLHYTDEGNCIPSLGTTSYGVSYRPFGVHLLQEEVPRPPIDLFKAIFAESSSESEVSDMEPDTEIPDTTLESSTQEQVNHSKITSTGPHIHTLASSEPKQWKNLSLLTTTPSPIITPLEQTELRKDSLQALNHDHSHSKDSLSISMSNSTVHPNASTAHMERRTDPSQAVVAGQHREGATSQESALSVKQELYGPPLPPQGTCPLASIVHSLLT